MQRVHPAIIMLFGGFMLLAASFFPNSGGKPISDKSLQGTLLLCIHEKQTPKVDETIAIRNAPAFVNEHGFSGFLVIDQDDPSWQDVIKTAASRNVTPPLLAAGVTEDRKVTGLRKVVPWQNGLEDILR